MKVCGIYGWFNKKTAQWYIGQSTDLIARYIQHNTANSNDWEKDLQANPNDWEYKEFIREPNMTKEELDLREAEYIDIYSAYEIGYNKTKGNHSDRIRKIMKSRMHFVNASLSEEVMRFANMGNFGIDNHFETVLIIGQFDCANYLKYAANVIIISDNLAYECKGDRVNIIRVNDISKEYIEVLNRMKDNKFDLIIANPPYGRIGAEITKYIVDNIDYDQFINLIPANDYTRVKGLINHVDLTTFKQAEGSFDDAAVNTWVANIVKKHLTITKEAFTLHTYDERLQRCYETFADREYYAIDSYKGGITVNDTEEGLKAHLQSLDNNVDFMITARTPQNGVHKLDGTRLGLDVKWNYYKEATWEDMHILYNKATKKYEATCGFIRFNTPEEKDNFTKWWYEGKLANMLIKGLNRTGGSIRPGLPKVDWTKAWTDEEILKDCGYTDEEIKELLK